MVYSNAWELAFGLASLGTGILSLLLAIAVLLGNPHLKENRTWALASLSVALWGGGLGIAILSPDKATSLMWNQIFYTGAVWIPTTYLWFSSTFTKKPLPATFLGVCSALSTGLMLILWFRIHWFIVDLAPHGPFRYWDILGPAYHVFTVFFFIGMGMSCFRLYRSLATDSSIEKRKLTWVAIGMTCGMLGGATNFFYKYHIEIYPFGQFLVFLYPLMISWAIVKHQALDIGVLLRKAGLFIVVYVLLIALVIPIPVYIHRELRHVLGPMTYMLFLEVLLLSAVLSIGPFIYALIVRRGSFFREDTLAGLTHELKSPLAAIESAIEMVQGFKLDPQRSGKDVDGYLEMIDRNTVRLRQYVEDLLFVFKAGDKVPELNTEIADVKGIVQKVIANTKPLADTKGLVLKLSDAGGDFSLRCDAARIEQVISNLLSNAMKFTKQGEISVRLKQNDEGVHVAVADTGMGIAPEDLSYVFERFYQGEAGRKSKGTGLGLAIAKLWVEAHGGEIHAESAGLGRGSRFWFTLPKG